MTEHRAIVLAWPENWTHAAQWWSLVTSHWPTGPAPAASLIPAADLRPGSSALDTAASADVAVLLASQHNHRDAARVVAHLGECQVPVVLVGAAPQLVEHLDDGQSLLALPGTVSPDAAAGVILGVASRQRTVRDLRQEAELSSRIHRGATKALEQFQEELKLAAMVQAASLPREMPTLPGIDFGALFRPCGAVSGDIYEILRLDEHHAAFFLADAAGHGVPAALLTMVISKALAPKEIAGRTYRLRDPHEVLERLNEALIARPGDPPRLASAVYGVVDNRTARVRLAGAGHPPSLLVDSHGATLLDHPGPLLGLDPDATFEPCDFTLTPGQTLVIHSDGFELAFPDQGDTASGRRRGNKKYIDHFAALRAGPRGETLSGALLDLEDRLNEQFGSLHQVDDMTVLAVGLSAANQQTRPAQAHAA